MQSHINLLFNRKISLFQRAAYANSCILSKVWYTSHIYPLTGYYSKEINKIIFNYLWCGGYEPIRRTTVFKPKKKGGLGLINCHIKSKVLLTKSFLNCYSSDEYLNPLMVHYCYLRMNNVCRKQFSVHNAALLSPPYYQAAMQTMDKFLQFPSFPILSNKKMYESMMPKDKPLVENLYQQFNWNKVWPNFSELKIRAFDKDIIFKHLHVCLATNSRLAWFNLANSNTCNLCDEDREQTALHIFYECTYIAQFYQCFLNILIQICNFEPNSNIKFLYFDSSYENNYQKKVCNLLLAAYISTVWRNRKENLRIGILKNLFIRKVNENIEMKKHSSNRTLEEIYGEYSSRLCLEELNKL